MPSYISIFFNATSENTTAIEVDQFQLLSLANLLHRISPKSYVFPGVATIHPIRGGLFGTGTDAQCQQALQLIQSELQSGKPLILNLYGHSRGAITALLLAKKLSHIDRNILQINLAMHDPVPGNLVITSQVDFLHLSLAKQAMNLQQCNPLKKVLCLYTNQRFPWYDIVGHAHAPLFPSYPAHTQVSEEIIPGRHSNAQVYIICNKVLHIDNPGSLISYLRIKTFLQESGTKFSALTNSYYHHNESRWTITSANQNQVLAHAYAHAQAKIQTSFNRLGHNHHLISTHAPATFFNAEHQRLIGDADRNNVQCKFHHTSPTHLITSLASISIASILFFTTNLGIFASLMIGLALFLVAETATKLKIEQETAISGRVAPA